MTTSPVFERTSTPVVEGMECALQMQSAALRTMLAVLQPGGGESSAAVAIRAELADVEGQLASIPDDRRPMHMLARRFGWSPLEVEFVWAACALAADPRVLVHARALAPDAVHGLTGALYCQIARLDAPAAHALGRALQPDRSLARSGLLQPAAGNWLPTSAPWRPAPELLHHLAGEPERLPAPLARVTAPPSLVHDDAQRAVIELLRATLGNPDVLFIVHGAEGTGRRTAVACATEAPVLALDVAHLDATAGALELALVSLIREASLRGAIAVLVGVDQLVHDDARLRALSARIDQSRVPITLLTTREGFELPSARPTVRAAWPVPDVGARAELWRVLAGERDDLDHGLLAQRYRIGAGAIGRAIASARAISHAAPDQALGTTEFAAGVRHNIAERMAGLAERVVVRQTWDDCVLPDEVAMQILALIGRAEQAHLVYEQWGYREKMPRGTGLAAMFSGPPGTGKTMVAGLIANQLGLELYQVDLSKVVSKWIGETEKQLATLFDAAEDGHAVLLFDEADALFGQRSTEVRGATDRYANLEVNFLLQRIESFHGIVILTTNLDASIDKAFKRRLAAHVVFQHPEEHERQLLWERMIAADGAPLARDIDVRALARQFPKMSGANIRNAALGAAFLTAAQRRPAIDHAALLAAARSEYVAMGHVFTAATL